MSASDPYKKFVLRYLTRGAVGVSVGLAAVATAAAHPAAKPAEQVAVKSFSERLAMVWRAGPQADETSDAAEPQQLAQGTIRPFPNIWRPSPPPHGKTHTKTFNKNPPPRPPHGKTHTKTFSKARSG
jgi:hypothetical protein